MLYKIIETALDVLIDSDPMLSLQRTKDMMCFISKCWQKTHSENLDMDQVRLFLCDQERGELTEEQKCFVLQAKNEVVSAYRSAVFKLMVFGCFLEQNSDENEQKSA